MDQLFINLEKRNSVSGEDSYLHIISEEGDKIITAANLARGLFNVLTGGEPEAHNQIPIMQVIEIFGLIAKPFSLMVRLFANILAGHAMILGLVSVIFVTVKLGPVINGPMTFFTMLFGVFMDCLELLVAFIQAYVFTMLSAVFIGMSRQEEHAD